MNQEGVTNIGRQGFNSFRRSWAESSLLSHHTAGTEEGCKRSKAGEASRDNEWAQKDITEKLQS
jgi:hypothetical protein